MTSLSKNLHACTAALVLAVAAASGESAQTPSTDDQSQQCIVIEPDLGKPSDASLASDLTLDGIVDINDVLMIFAGWGPCLIDAPCATDIAPPLGDGATDLQDLLLVLSNWGVVDP